MMEEAWVNEKFAPEILPHKMEVVDCLLGRLLIWKKTYKAWLVQISEKVYIS
ncbi:unnamed protein product [Callosobruchus maculatus]|uniref:Uncharacterized protein n=1 Tax=Callosobruchus maculatus TaxID=64391 RepID=A0A653BPF1_CALMS|nr:unnamed protein product [Callosobruchus maculatus]